MLIGLEFPPLQAAGLALIANTAPVACGAIGTPILTLATVTGLPAHALSAMAGRQLPLMSLLIPAWLVVTMSGWRGLRGVWPVVLVSGGSFAVVQFLWSNFVGPELVDIVGGLTSLGAVVLFCRVWRPRDVWDFPRSADAPGPLVATEAAREMTPGGVAHPPGRAAALVPWLLLSVFVLMWGLPSIKAKLNGTGTTMFTSASVAPAFDVPALHRGSFAITRSSATAPIAPASPTPRISRRAPRRRDSPSTGSRRRGLPSCSRPSPRC